MNLNRTEVMTREYRYDQLTPVSVYAVLAGQSACMMESAYDEGYGTYSFIGVDPVARFEALNRTIQIQDEEGTRLFEGDPYEALAEFSKGERVFGLISYDAARLKEVFSNRHVRTNKLPDFLFYRYRSILRFDHQAHLLQITHRGTALELDHLCRKIFSPIALSQFNEPLPCLLTPDLTDEAFIERVKKAQTYIRAGEIFQVVLSRTFSAKTEVKPFDLYRALRLLSPTSYLALFEDKAFAVAGASPELLVGVRQGIIESVPIAGTCKKGQSLNALLEDPKENAEHVMLVDLARNDVGQLSKPGTVQVAEYKSVRDYSYVTHLVSRVIGELDPRYSPLQVLKNCLPAGTLSGAPKIRAMDIIDELEASHRGLYGGAFVMLDEQGDVTSAIAIRTAYFESGRVEVRTGAGVVLSSIPEKEAEETRLKASGVLSALELASGLKEQHHDSTH